MAAIVLGWVPDVGAVTLSTGDALVADGSALGGGAVFRVDVASGATATVTSGALGEFSAAPRGIAVEADRSVLIALPELHAVARVDAAGHQTPVSIGAALQSPAGVAVEADGDILVADSDAAGGEGAVIRLDRVTGAQTVVASGGRFSNPVAIALQSNGNILVADIGTVLAPVILSVDPATGAQSVLASGGPLGEPDGLAVEANGDILIADPGAQAVLRIDANTHAITTVASGPPLITPVGVAVQGDGNILVADSDAFGGAGGVIQINRSTGTFATVASDSPFSDPAGIAVVKRLNAPPTLTVPTSPVKLTPTNADGVIYGSATSGYPGISATDDMTAHPAISCTPAAPHTFPLGSDTTVSCTATDQASASTTKSFTVHVNVTPTTLCLLTTRYVQSSAKYKALRSKTSVDKLLGVACKNLDGIVARLSPAKKATLIALYRKTVDELAAQGFLSTAQSGMLKGLAGQL